MGWPEVTRICIFFSRERRGDSPHSRKRKLLLLEMTYKLADQQVYRQGCRGMPLAYPFESLSSTNIKSRVHETRLFIWRRRGDSNPRCRLLGTTVFETVQFNHSCTSPLHDAQMAPNAHWYVHFTSSLLGQVACRAT